MTIESTLNTLVATFETSTGREPTFIALGSAEYEAFAEAARPHLTTKQVVKGDNFTWRGISVLRVNRQSYVGAGVGGVPS